MLFDREIDGADGKEFFALCREDRHHFRMIISPENGHEIGDFHGYVRTVMGRMERDLGTKLAWISAVHYDTDDVHAHVIIRGKNERGEDLVLGRDYIAAGIRGRAQEVATELLGERTLEQARASMEREVDALRVTSLDRFIERQAGQGGEVDVRRGFGRDVYYEGLIRGRLRVLEKAGLAAEQAPGVYALKDGYRETLAEIGMRNNVIKKLYGRVERGLEGLAVYSLRGADAPVVEGRVADKGPADELSDRQYIVIEDAAARLHYVALGENRRFEEIGKGSIVRVRPGGASTGKADHNIGLIAQRQGGIYDVQAHREAIAREGYLGSHLRRLETLEKNGIVRSLGNGRYEVPGDVVERGAAVTREIHERESKRFYPMLDVLSALPPEKQAGQAKKTWLDRQLYRIGKGERGVSSYDPQTRAALAARQDWLTGKDLGVIQSGGEFALRQDALLRLDRMEVYEAGRVLAGKAGLAFDRSRVQEGEAYRYLGYVRLESGIWAVAARGKGLQMAHVEKEPDEIKPQELVLFVQREDGKYEVRSLTRQRQKEQGRGRDDDPEREL